MTKMLLVLILAVGSLAGCDKLEQLGQATMAIAPYTPVLVLEPGTEVMSRQSRIVIYGDDPCPGDDARFREVPGQNCIVITPDRQVVPVHVAVPDSRLPRVMEPWVVRRTGDKKQQISFLRPDGSVVGPLAN